MQENTMIQLMAAYGSIITILIGSLAYWVKKWMSDREVIDKKILDNLDNIKEQIHLLQTENQLQSATMREIESRVELRFQGVERRLDVKRQSISDLTRQLNAIEKANDRLCLLHQKNHPEDNI